ncbi:hypothetical protein [Blastococcus brunescens]|uniref:EfeO-type cupredoxin-like domain-containing protein n=1 Tax=Blastococcus brunescens TaxID=1564165 RepID=A0ABZ1B0Z1_9ACTN|nr:hypothetical protein [Blastococcus sp. BMG 8361]WRL64477.1 hypothetical protein U6N30_01105 [Blastococcus sp. BMG 8361]
MLTGVLAGCGAEDAPASGSGAAPSTAPGVGEVTTAPDGVQEITLQTQDDYVFLPATFTVDPGTVRLTVTNVAEEMTHNLEFDEGRGRNPSTRASRCSRRVRRRRSSSR